MTNWRQPLWLAIVIIVMFVGAVLWFFSQSKVNDFSIDTARMSLHQSRLQEMLLTNSAGDVRMRWQNSGTNPVILVYGRVDSEATADRIKRLVTEFRPRFPIRYKLSFNIHAEDEEKMKKAVFRYEIIRLSQYAKSGDYWAVDFHSKPTEEFIRQFKDMEMIKGKFNEIYVSPNERTIMKNESKKRFGRMTISEIKWVSDSEAEVFAGVLHTGIKYTLRPENGAWAVKDHLLICVE